MSGTRITSVAMTYAGARVRRMASEAVGTLSTVVREARKVIDAVIHFHVGLSLWKCIFALPSHAPRVVFPYERHQDDLASAVGSLS